MSDAVTSKPVAKPVRGELLSVKETARRLGISASWIYNALKQAVPPFDYMNPTPGRYFFDSADIDDYLASRRWSVITNSSAQKDDKGGGTG
jgi:predicted DNA-binding transcriptional regulator AlpA